MFDPWTPWTCCFFGASIRSIPSGQKDRCLRDISSHPLVFSTAKTRCHRDVFRHHGPRLQEMSQGELQADVLVYNHAAHAVSSFWIGGGKICGKTQFKSFHVLRVALGDRGIRSESMGTSTRKTMGIVRMVQRNPLIWFLGETSRKFLTSDDNVGSYVLQAGLPCGCGTRAQELVEVARF